jgi:Xaa-Pro aminopeptidase
MLEFESLTLAPIDLALIEPSIMTQKEISWLNRYHARVLETIGPLVEPKTAVWLEEATQPLLLKSLT